jgi:hypothetical protein
MIHSSVFIHPTAVIDEGPEEKETDLQLPVSSAGLKENK